MILLYNQLLYKRFLLYYCVGILLPFAVVNVAHNQGVQKGTGRQSLGFFTADFQSWLVFESAVQKPKHCRTCSFLHFLQILQLWWRQFMSSNDKFFLKNLTWSRFPLFQGESPENGPSKAAAAANANNEREVRAFSSYVSALNIRGVMIPFFVWIGIIDIRFWNRFQYPESIPVHWG